MDRLSTPRTVRSLIPCRFFFFFFNDTATTEIYTLSLHDALPVCTNKPEWLSVRLLDALGLSRRFADRKSTRLNSSHPSISYAVFCLKKQKKHLFSFSFKYINVPKCLDTDSLSCR